MFWWIYLPVALLAASFTLDVYSSVRWDRLRASGAPLREINFLTRDPRTGGYSIRRGLLWGSVAMIGIALITRDAWAIRPQLGGAASLLTILSTIVELLVVRNNFRIIRRYESIPGKGTR